MASNTPKPRWNGHFCDCWGNRRASEGRLPCIYTAAAALSASSTSITVRRSDVPSSAAMMSATVACTSTGRHFERPPMYARHRALGALPVSNRGKAGDNAQGTRCLSRNASTAAWRCTALDGEEDTAAAHHRLPRNIVVGRTFFRMMTEGRRAS
jgi:hypothetical protein